MKFNEFVDYIVDNITDYLMRDDIEKIEVQKTRKNNNCIFTGMLIFLKDNNLQPNIYLEPFYNDYKSGKDLDDILQAMASDFNQALNNMITVSEDILSEEQIKRKCFLKLVNYKKNEEELEHAPYIPFHDLAITFWCLVDDEGNSISSFMINQKHMDLWDISIEELYCYAKKNTTELFPMLFTRLDKMLSGIVNVDNMTKEIEMYILTNRQNINGSIYMTYKKVMEDVSEQIGANMFIIPSSINEVLILPDKGNIDKKYIEGLVKDVNENVVSPLEFLSNTVYYYDCKTKMIEI